jgi:large subunit ribosomal protein LP0
MPVSDAKAAYAVKLNSLLDKYDRILFVQINNVRSQQLHLIRRDLRGKAELLMGKNTMQKRIITNRAEEGEVNVLKEKLVDAGILVGNRGMLFTNEAPEAIQAILKNHRIQAPAKVGAISPVDVVVPAGNTGMEPTTTSFFQALGVQTKIAKGTVEITVEKKVLSTGDKVDAGCATLLQKLKISPFWYEAEVECIWDRGVVFTADDLSVTDELLEASFLAGINNVTALSLGAGVPTEASFPHLVVDAFKSLLAISLETEYSFEEFNGKQLKDDIKSGKSATAAAPAAAAKSAAPAAKAAVAADSESEDDMGMGGLF